MGILKSDGTGRRLDGDLGDGDRAFDDRVGDEEIRDALHGVIDRFFDRLAGKDAKDGASAALDGGAASSASPGASAAGGIVAAEPDLPAMMRRLAEVGEPAWGRYILANDMLRDKIDPDEGDTMAAEAAACGREWAARVAERYGTRRPGEIAAALGVTVADSPAPVSGRRALFAQYLPGSGDDARIEVLADPLNRYGRLRERLLAAAADADVDVDAGAGAGEPDAGDPEAGRELERILPTVARVRTLLLAHELFHVIEDRNEASIYTRTATISLWKVFGRENRSTVRGLGEIGAGAFARELVGAPFCPFALDVLLMWAYAPDNARALYRQVLRFDE